MSNLPWIDVAESFLGTKEVPGPKSNPIIVQWAKDIGGYAAKYYTTDSIPWCALFTAYCLIKGGCKVDIDNPLWVPNYHKYGTHCRPVYGCVMDFGYHIGFYISEDDDYYHILGGNQSDMVNVIRIPKHHLVSSRWPTEKLDLLVDGPIINKHFTPGY